ncbi:RodZ domain-containing protein [Oceanisphaera ostreae]|uniref:RodZ domain-containing protein n=1 Tax=Oceanisphaera ostreae TaxID=914151 RepID=A0ABW3KDT3_9GAMM
MTINEAEPQPQADPVVTTGPGILLREAREAKGWTQAEVARRLNLRLAVIEAIDNDHDKAGVALTFLRGYVKAYAKVVGVPEAQVLSAFDSMSGHQPESDAPMKSFSKKTRQQASDKWLKRISWLVFLGLLASLVYWWWQDGGAQQMGRGLPPESEQTMASEPLVADSEAPALLPTPREDVGELVPLAPTNADSNIVPNAESNGEAAPVAEPTPQPEPVPEPVVDPRLLTMSFSDDCWIKVTDSRGQVLSEGVKKAKQTLALAGEPPFRVILGVPTAASVEYMNQEVDLSSFSAGRAARLTIPKS